MKSSRVTVKLLTCCIAAALAACLAWLFLRKSAPVSGDALPSARGTAGPGTVDMVGTTQPHKPGQGDSASSELVSIRERARKRVDEIRTTQEQLRTGANPDEVKEPVGGK